MGWKVCAILCMEKHRKLDLSQPHMTAKNRDNNNNKNIEEEEDLKIAKRRSNCCSLSSFAQFLRSARDPLAKRKFLSAREFKRFPLASELVVQVANFSCELWLRIGG